MSVYIKQIDITPKRREKKRDAFVQINMGVASCTCIMYKKNSPQSTMFNESSALQEKPHLNNILTSASISVGKFSFVPNYKWVSPHI